MKFTIQKKTLLEGLKLVGGAVGRGSTLPILGCVLIEVGEARQQSLRLVATNLDVTIEVSLHLDKDVGEAGACAVRAKLLESIVSDVPVDSAELEFRLEKAGNVPVRLHVRCGAGFYKLMALEANEFPPTPILKGPPVEIELAEFNVLFASVRAAQSEDDSRYVLNGCDWVIAEGHQRTVATDGRRLLSMRTTTIGGGHAPVTAIVPADSVAQLLRILPAVGDGQVKATFSGAGHAPNNPPNQAQFEFGRIRMVTKLIDGTFPNVDQVIPADGRSVVLQRSELLAALKRLRRIGEAALLTFSKNCLSLSAKAEKTTDEGLESIALVCAEELVVKLNIDFLTDALESIGDDTVKLQFTKPWEPFVVRSMSVDWLALIMPLRTADAQAEPAAPLPNVEQKETEGTKQEEALGSGRQAVGTETAQSPEPTAPIPPPTATSPDNDFAVLQAKAEQAILNDDFTTAEVLKKRLKIGFSLACKIIDELEASGIVGPFITKGANKGKREVKIKPKA